MSSVLPDEAPDRRRLRTVGSACLMQVIRQMKRLPIGESQYANLLIYLRDMHERNRLHRIDSDGICDRCPPLTGSRHDSCHAARHGSSKNRLSAAAFQPLSGARTEGCLYETSDSRHHPPFSRHRPRIHLGHDPTLCAPASATLALADRWLYQAC